MTRRFQLKNGKYTCIWFWRFPGPPKRIQFAYIYMTILATLYINELMFTMPRVNFSFVFHCLYLDKFRAEVEKSTCYHNYSDWPCQWYFLNCFQIGLCYDPIHRFVITQVQHKIFAVALFYKHIFIWIVSNYRYISEVNIHFNIVLTVNNCL